MSCNTHSYLLGYIVLLSSFLYFPPVSFATHSSDDEVMELVQSCAVCHGKNGIGALASVPYLAGQNANYLEKSFLAYASGERENDSMQALAADLSAENITAISLYFAALPPFSSREDETLTPYISPDPYALAKPELEICAGCHGEEGNSYIEGMPSLAGQGQGYLKVSLKAYRDSTRPDGTMQYFIEGMSDELIENIALYYSRLSPLGAEATWPGDPFAGQAPAEHCAACHGAKGNSISQTMGRIAGQDASYIEASMLAYLDGSRDHISMQEILTSLSSAEIANIAAYFSSQSPLMANNTHPLTAKGWAERCNRCHGDDGKSLNTHIPKLAGQNETYLVKVLKLYHRGKRTDARMMAMSYVLSEREILDLAAYYARIPAAE